MYKERYIYIYIYAVMSACVGREQTCYVLEPDGRHAMLSTLLGSYSVQPMSSIPSCPGLTVESCAALSTKNTSLR